MKQLNRRLGKIEDIVELKKNQQESISGVANNMTSEEMEAIVNKTLKKTGPSLPLYAKTIDGYVKVYEIKPWYKLRPICDAYGQMKIKLFDASELEQMGVEPVQFSSETRLGIYG